MTNPNPNQPRYPYGGGTDNPSEDTGFSHPGGPSNVAAVETAPLTTNESSLTASVVRHPPLPAGLAQGGTDTVLPEGVQSVPITAAGLEGEVLFRSSDPEGGIDPVTGEPRESGQNETAGATGTLTGEAPSEFPSPNP